MRCDRRYRDFLHGGAREDPGSIREDVRLVAEAQDDGEEGHRVRRDLRPGVGDRGPAHARGIS